MATCISSKFSSVLKAGTWQIAMHLQTRLFDHTQHKRVHGEGRAESSDEVHKRL